MSTYTRQRRAIATILDPQVLLQAGRTALAVEHPDLEPSKLETEREPYMLLPVNRGEAAVLGSEGVGTIAREDDTVGVWFRTGFQLIRLQLSLEAIAAAATNERIDIADGIRVFGSRLDSNHALWFARYDTVNAPVAPGHHTIQSEVA